MSMARSLTMGRVSNPRPLAEPSCLCTGTEIGDSEHTSVSNAVVGARSKWSTGPTGTTLSGEILKSMIPFNGMSEKMISVAHLVGLSELEPVPIDDEVGSRDKWIREDSFPLKDPAMLRMRLVLDCLLLDMMIVREKVAWACSSHDKLFNRSPIFTLHTKLVWQELIPWSQLCNLAIVKAPLMSARRRPYSSLCSL